MKDINIMIVSHFKMSNEMLILAVNEILKPSKIVTVGYDPDFITKVNQVQPNLILIDLHANTINGLSIIKNIKHKHPEIKIVIVDANFRKSKARRLINAGIDAYVHFNEDIKSLGEAIILALDGKKYIAPELATQLAIDVIYKEVELFDQLTDREYEVLNMFMYGMSRKEIAKHLNISATTVSDHLSSLSKKVTASNNGELVLKAVKHDLLKI